MKKEPIFRGVCTALCTPFRETSIDFEAMEEQIERQITAGVAALAVCGTTGENATLTDAEHKRLIRFAVERVRGRIPLIAGTGSNDTAHAIEMSRYAADVGADALLTVTPYYNKTSQEGLYRSFIAIADAVNCPIILYNVPSRTCVDTSPETYARLSEHPNIVGVKEASPSLAKVIKTRRLCADALTVYSGNDDLTLPLLAVGAQGVISVVSNLIPERMCSLYDAWAIGDVEGAAEQQIALEPLMAAMFCEVNPVPVKYAMSLMGLCREDVRLPLCAPDRTNREKIGTLLSEYGLI